MPDPRPNARRNVAALVLFACASAPAASAQAPEYRVLNMGKVPGSYITYGKGLNDHGVVVGSALFIPGGHQAWTWSLAQGYALLPPPPTITDYAAVDINNAGVIAGDGGGDAGEIWRYTAGTYEMLGVLPGTPIPKAAAINEFGTITGTCQGTLFYKPEHSFVAVTGSPMANALSDSEAYDVNDAGQITGSQALKAYRLTPGQGVEYLPPLGDKNLMAGYAINNLGTVVGVAASLAEHSDVPFLYSDANGTQEIGDFGGRAYAIDVNAVAEVVGNWEPTSGTRKPWVWSAHQGVRLLNDAIDPGLGLSVRRAHAINNAGEILCDAYDANSELVTLLLTPTSYCQPDLGFGGPGTATLEVCGAALLSGKAATLRVESDVPSSIAFVGWGASANPTPFGAGTVVPNPLAGLFALPTDATGNAVVPGIAGGGGPATAYLQAFVLDPAQPGWLQFTNAVEVNVLP